MSGLIEKVVGDVGGKKRWREYRARVRALPPGYRAAVGALQRYLTHRGVVTEGDVLVDLHVELVEVFERAAAQGTPIREVVGADPAHFADTLLGGHAADRWIDGERQRLVTAIAAVPGAATSSAATSGAGAEGGDRP
jgi:DNA-binding ferritin-like protein (Dps family)